jgi:hypothetical protein
MRTFTCTACGDTVTVRIRSQTVGKAVFADDRDDYGDCPGCGAHFDGLAIDEITGNQAQGNVPCVDLLRAARMLRCPGLENVQWVREQLAGQILGHESVLVVPLSAVRSYAVEHDIQIDPLADRRVIWVPRARTG